MTNSLPLQWHKSPQGCIKISTDGFSYLQDGDAGFVLRNHLRACLGVGKICVQHKMDIKCEALATKEWLLFASNGGFTRIQIETDSLISCNTFTKDVAPPLAFEDHHSRYQSTSSIIYLLYFSILGFQKILECLMCQWFERTIIPPELFLYLLND